MSALRPLPDDRSARGVASERYPLNAVCAHPECREPVADPHHTFGRSKIIGDSWFVEITPEPPGKPYVIPHVAGVCRAHHDAVENHEAWIRLEGEGFVWYDRDETYDDPRNVEWVKLGLLNPQPGSREGKPKKKRKTGEARKARAVIAVRVPQDAQENGGQVWDEALEAAEERFGFGADPRPPYYTIIDALHTADPEDYSARRLAELSAWLAEKDARGITQVRITSALAFLRGETT